MFIYRKRRRSPGIFTHMVIIVFIVLSASLCLTSVMSSALSNLGWIKIAGYVVTHESVQSIGQSEGGKMVTDSAKLFDASNMLKDSNSSAQLGLALSEYLEGNEYDAFNRFQKTVANGRTDPVTLLVYGNLAEKMDSLDIAYNSWRLAKAEILFVRMGQSELATGDLDAALDLFLRAINVNPEFVPAYMEIGQLHYSKGEFLLAEDALKSAVAYSPNRESLAWLGRTQEQLGQLEDAIISYQRAAELGELWYGYLAAGDLFIKQQDYVAARDSYLRALGSFPQVVMIQLKLGNLELLQGNSEQAKLYFDSALVQAPLVPDVYFYMGSWFYDQREYDQALLWFEKSIELGQQTDYWLYRFMADSQFHVGKCDLSLANYRRALGSFNVPDLDKDYIINQIAVLEGECKGAG